MSGLYDIVGILFAVILRIGIPIGITALLIMWLRRLDVRWKAEAEQQQLSADGLVALSLRPPCWEFTNCPAEQRDPCPAYSNTDIACWQLFRDSRGFMKDDCLSCPVLVDAPQPFVVHEEPSTVEVMAQVEEENEK